MTPEREAELFVKLDMLMEMSRRQSILIEDLAQRVSRVEGRIEEQSRMLQLALGSRVARSKPAA
ncbi:MAG: hypothetical protein A3G18_04235 [Rhodospirillales bacterium RIFCSPLOWO2_12_FULL_58_28]|nr:MAG: hypothetical protein A3H92_05115 [Rhodospirillales bacterium RIFCSPLOWO2_02_FULL_58_16]OHC78725.1 MAG: hypothetical protein A3G18_04235 [Rhodospirillales bacterium RIFCSPLOWO2_12_FULL_58_28]